MAIHTLIDFNGFRSGTEYGIDSIGTNSGLLVDTAANHGITNVFPLSKQGADPYIAEVSNADINDWAMSKTVSSPSSVWLMMGFDVYFEVLHAQVADKTFFRCGNGNTDTHWTLRYNTDGDLTLYDADGSLVATGSGKIEVEKWYRVVVMFQWGDSSTLKLWWGELDGDHELLFDESAMDTKGTGNTVGAVLLNDSIATSNTPHYICNYVFMTSDQANWDDNDLTGTISNMLFMGDPTDPATCGDWTVLRYKSGILTDVPSTGDNLSSGTYDDAEQVPGQEGFGNEIRYTWPFGGATNDLQGTLYTIDPDGDDGGPSGDADADNEYVGAKWTGRGKLQFGAGKPGVSLICGKWDGSSLTTTSVPFSSTSYQNRSRVEGGSTDVRVPESDEWMALGMFGNYRSTNGHVWMADFYATILHAETPPAVSTKKVILDGLVIVV